MIEAADTTTIGRVIREARNVAKTKPTSRKASPPARVHPERRMDASMGCPERETPMSHPVRGNRATPSCAGTPSSVGD
jgi:hypothetical protein